MKTIETLILSSLLYNESFLRKVVPFIRDDYFSHPAEKYIFKQTAAFVEEYGTAPTPVAIQIQAENDNTLIESEYRLVVKALENLEPPIENVDWLLDQAEKFCKEQALFNAVTQAIHIIEGRDKNHTKEAIPHLLQDALTVSFDNSIGHDYVENAEDRHDYYTRVEEKLPFDLEAFNLITKGGFSRKTLNVAMAGPGVGKSTFMCHVSASALSMGKNVLYITMEMAEERIAERIDANLLNVPVDDLARMDKEKFLERIRRLRKRTEGKLIIKEYPTSSAHAGHFRALLRDLQIKKEFVPDLICVDYLNICASSRFKANNTVNSYSYVKAIAEEVRGLAVEFDVPILTATQTTRDGNDSSEVEMKHVSESFGVPATADLFFAMTSTEELEAMNQILIKQLKNRYADINKMKKFLIGVDRDRMKMYDLSDRF